MATKPQIKATGAHRRRAASFAWKSRRRVAMPD